jgi:hypothetical protein
VLAVRLRLRRDFGASGLTMNAEAIGLPSNLREGVNADRIEQMQPEMSEGEWPEGVPATEIVVLHDAEAERSLTILSFATQDDYKRGDETLNAMPTGDTPGRRTAVAKYDVAIRMTA